MTALSVFASGLVTGLGFNAPATLAALRAGVSALRQTPWSDIESGEPLRGVKVPLPQWWEGLGKLADLVAPAIGECLAEAEPVAPKSIPLLIATACGERPERTARLEEDLLDEVCIRLELPQNPHSAVFPLDQFGAVQALMRARTLIEQGHARRVIVAGVDSFLHQATLDAYVLRRRVMTPSNFNGFFPGEAGTAVLVGSDHEYEGDALRILGLGVGQEPATIESTTSFRATGLTQALRQALGNAGVALKDVAYRLTDLTGEHYKFKEAEFAAGRLDGGTRPLPLGLWHPMEYLGNIGAAVLPCLLAQAMHAAQEGYAPGPLAVCHVSNDGGERAAIVVGLRGPEKGRHA
ncbi:hypothetical protein CBA19CS11_30385 [Caballeronia novacaledonica]|uniref:hypothetical protein n=1 Tax=Caballeronia novacaledonica TaxID=1544861 RepID=UPI001EE25B09|nr:hypothetical protein [Caballeronia novacaledonica]GJH13237.1 hypothetical protein CBA19CS11_30385 [Caballeronia novacaledonica]